MSAEQMATPRLLAPNEVGVLVRLLRGLRQWSQDTLAALSGLSVRTIQRVERGEPSDRETRRALARAFGQEDLDIFNKPHTIQNDEELKAEQEKFEREHLILDAMVMQSGRQLANFFEGAHLSSIDLESPGVELVLGEAAEEFAALADYLKDYVDCAELYSHTDRLGVFEELQGYLDSLGAAGIAVVCARREANLVGKDWVEKTPWRAKAVYMAAFPKSAVPTKIAVAKTIHLRW
jgi:transcriptional regulator with XRE-family HTH domain